MGAVILGYTIWVAYVGTTSKNWPTTQATIASATTHTETRKDGTVLVAEIKYTYEVGDKRYQGKRVNLTNHGTTGDGALDLTSRYSAGSITTVSYNPANPSFSLLIPGIPRGTRAIAGIGALGVTVSLAMGVPMIRQYRRLRSGQSNQEPAVSHVEIFTSSPVELFIRLRPGRQGTSDAGGIAAIGIGLAFFFGMFFLPDLLDWERWTGNSIVLLVGSAGALLVGLWQFATYLRLRFELQTLRLTTREAVLERRLAGIVRRRRVQLSDGAAARLAWDHDANNQQVYAVIIEGADRPLRFAASLPTRDKQDVIERINEFLGVQTPEPVGNPTK